MLPSERHSIILELVSRQPAVTIRGLTERLSVSRETVRKDIEQLAGEGKLLQVRGGATRVQTREAPFANRTKTNLAGKARIAAHVAAQVPNGSSVIIDNGSTTLLVAEALAKMRIDLNVITNDLSIAAVLGPVAREVTLLGGRLDPGENATIGHEALTNLSRYRAEFALVSAGGLSRHALFTDFSREAADLRSGMLQRAEVPMILADSSKFGVVGQAVLGDIPSATRVIVDAAPEAQIAQSLETAGLRVDLAD